MIVGSGVSIRPETCQTALQAAESLVEMKGALGPKVATACCVLTPQHANHTTLLTQ